MAVMAVTMATMDMDTTRLFEYRNKDETCRNLRIFPTCKTIFTHLSMILFLFVDFAISLGQGPISFQAQWGGKISKRWMIWVRIYIYAVIFDGFFLWYIHNKAYREAVILFCHMFIDHKLFFFLKGTVLTYSKKCWRNNQLTHTRTTFLTFQTVSRRSCNSKADCDVILWWSNGPCSQLNRIDAPNSPNFG